MINISSSFNLSSNLPLDNRTVFNTLVEANALNINYRYYGLMIYVKSLQKYYYIKDDINTYVEFTTSGGGTSETTLKDWVSGTSYLQYQGLVYNGVIFRTKLAVVNSTINPISDSTNFEALGVSVINTFDKSVNTTDNITEGTNNKFMTVAEKSILANLNSPFLFKGEINTNVDFPLVADVKAGWTYTIKADVIDDDATKTNTGLSFVANEEITWSDSNTWISLGVSKGDMNKSVYDSNGDGKVDSAEIADNALKLNGQVPSYYATNADVGGKIDKIASAIADEIVIAKADGTVINSGKKITDITKASEITLDVTAFDKNLTATEDTLQKAMEKIDDLTLGGGSVTYTTSSPTINAIGGIPAGKVYTSADITTVLNDLLFPYTAPLISLSGSVAGGVRKYGNVINGLNLTATTTKKSNPITSVEFFRNGSSINAVSTPNANGGSELYTENTVINDTCSFTAKVGDGTQTITSGTLTYTFVNPFYVGSCVNAIPTEVDILAMSELIKTKSNTTFAHTLTNSRFCIAYPTSLGSLTSILDQNAFEVLTDFTLTVVPVTINAIAVNYNTYCFNNVTTQTAFSMQYKF